MKTPPTLVCNVFTCQMKFETDVYFHFQQRFCFVSTQVELAEVLFFFFLSLNIYLFLREGQSTSGGGTEREGDTETEAGPRLQAVSTEPDVGLRLTNHEIVT